MLKIGKLEASGGGILAIVILGVGAVSIIENGIVAAVKWRRIRGLESLASMANSVEGVEAVADEFRKHEGISAN